jgi:hypothetical protein
MYALVFFGRFYYFAMFFADRFFPKQRRLQLPCKMLAADG